ncbi:MAG: CDP-diacylglycerol--glycerol-3-phosphate 3-phosphatidyltransferase [Planctomycetaceae bacterium]|nr:CDP-diacylglycerol--glycerol-3-phosphate 3-phosphatidyltransferase [Planctomycetaceae bacterium]
MSVTDQSPQTQPTEPESQDAAPVKTAQPTESVPNNADWKNLPNLITTSRLGLAIVVFILIDIDDRLWITAASIFVFAAATDALDGYIARKYGMVTTLGRILDPFVDKIIVCGSFVFLLEKPESGVSAWMVTIVIGREMFITALRSFMEQQGKDFSADWAGKVKMVLQCVAITASLLSLSPTLRGEAIITIRNVLLWSTVAVTAYSGISYTFKAVRLLSQTDEPR